MSLRAQILQKTLAVTAAVCITMAGFSALAYEFSLAPASKSAGTQTSGTVTIEYQQISAMVTTNVEVLKSKNALSTEIISTHDIDQQINDAIDKYYDTLAEYDSKKGELHAQLAQGIIDDETYIASLEKIEESYDAALEGIDDQIESLQKARNNALYSQQSASLGIASTLKMQINSAHTSFLTYYSLNEKLSAAQSQLEYLRWQESIARAKLEKKLISQDAYNTAFDAIQPQKEAIESIVTQLKKNELSLKTALGLSLSTTIKYGALPAFDLSGITTLNKDIDRQIYVERSLEIQSAANAARKADVDFRNDTDKLFDLDSANLSYEQSVENAQREFEATFDSMQDAYKSYKNAEKAHEDKIKELTKLNTKLEKGATSKNSVLAQEYVVYQSGRNLQSTAIELYIQYQSYLNSLTL